MNSKLILVCLLLLVVTTGSLNTQTGNNISVGSKDDPLAVKLTRNLSETDTYVWPKDPKVMENLKKWQGYKFGLLNHMG